MVEERSLSCCCEKVPFEPTTCDLGGRFRTRSTGRLFVWQARYQGNERDIFSTIGKE